MTKQAQALGNTTINFLHTVGKTPYRIAGNFGGVKTFTDGSSTNISRFKFLG